MQVAKEENIQYKGNPLQMKYLPLAERPYEKCMEYGAEVLSDAELLAVIIKTGNSDCSAVDLSKIVIRSLPEKNISGLFQISLEQLMELKGIGPVKAVQLKCLAELTRRMLRCGQSKKELVCCEPEKVAAYFMNIMRFLETEQVRLLILNGKNMLMQDLVISQGSFTSAMASPREIYYYAVKHKAVSILIIHNHPSGDPTPSREDFLITRRLSEAGELIGVPLLDHIVIGDNRYISFRQNGYLGDKALSS